MNYEALICVYPNPTADFSINQSEVSINAPTVITTNTSSGAVAYEWDFSDNSSSNEFEPIKTFDLTQNNYEITLTALNEYGCEDQLTQVIQVKETLLFYVPNAFTPDNDNYNEVFKPVFTEGFDPYNYQLTLFNRWGEIIFESFNAEVGWDGKYNGKVAKDGTYIWRINFLENSSSSFKEYVGHFTLIR